MKDLVNHITKNSVKFKIFSFYVSFLPWYNHIYFE